MDSRYKESSSLYEIPIDKLPGTSSHKKLPLEILTYLEHTVIYFLTVYLFGESFYALMMIY